MPRHEVEMVIFWCRFDGSENDELIVTAIPIHFFLWANVQLRKSDRKRLFKREDAMMIGRDQVIKTRVDDDA